MCISGNFHTAKLVIEWKKTPIQPPKHKSWLRPEILLRFVFQWIDFGCHATMKNVLQIIDWRENWTTRLSDTGRPRTRTSNEAEYYFKSLSEKGIPVSLARFLKLKINAVKFSIMKQYSEESQHLSTTAGLIERQWGSKSINLSQFKVMIEWPGAITKAATTPEPWPW